MAAGPESAELHAQGEGGSKRNLALNQLSLMPQAKVVADGIIYGAFISVVRTVVNGGWP